jgi:hypothetical protein
MKKYKSNAIFWLDYLFVFILVIYAGKATTFVRSLETWENIWGLLFILSFTVAFAFRQNVGITVKFIYLILGFTIYFLALTLEFQEIHPRFFGIYLINFYIAFVSISSLKKKFFVIYEHVLYYLCLIALIFWAIQQVIPNEFASILKTLAFLEPGAGNVESSIIIYTINNVVAYHFNFLGLPICRNSGFAWEPGALAVFINLAIFINMFRNRFQIKNNRRFWLFVIVLITTFSTTGYGIFMLLILFYVYNQHVKYMLWLSPLAIILCLYLVSLPFMTDKLIEISQQDTEQQIENSITYGGSYAPQRITSFLIDWQDFLNNPILGYGGHGEERWTTKLGADIASISGIGKIFARFGLVGVVGLILYKLGSS